MNLAEAVCIPDSLATERFWSGIPYAIGDQPMKYSLTPCSGTAKGTFNADGSRKLLHTEHDYLRDDLHGRLAKDDICFDFFVQIRKGRDQMPVERASIE